MSEVAKNDDGVIEEGCEGDLWSIQNASDGEALGESDGDDVGAKCVENLDHANVESVDGRAALTHFSSDGRKALEMMEMHVYAAGFRSFQESGDFLEDAESEFKEAVADDAPRVGDHFRSMLRMEAKEVVVRRGIFLFTDAIEFVRSEYYKDVWLWAGDDWHREIFTTDFWACVLDCYETVHREVAARLSANQRSHLRDSRGNEIDENWYTFHDEGYWESRDDSR